MPAVPDPDPIAVGDYVVRPALWHGRCLNGHDLDVAGRGRGGNQALDLPTGRCELCVRLGLPRAEWLEVDLRPRDGMPATSSGLQLAVRPPFVLAGIEQIMLQLRDVTIADLDMQMCGACKVGVVEQVRVDDAYLRRGIGTVLVTAALVRGQGYRWSTTAITDTAAAGAFWAGQQLPDGMTLGAPERCTHMLEASEFA
ncbi:hypothetical protein ED92_10570 [Amycolatopsis sp. MJM2582]|uniref:hypothetical protein n=1 Tax=Amycolatopsis sp. MJM2582 TaxID=1427749 RepID=UPI0004FFB242|nr:hypothetical protein [Amycolatopsis sp. MJM2582]KFZ80779.1 hypothetical protein ED92_10570 [Amycolatopsis sp. MJM2582]